MLNRDFSKSNKNYFVKNRILITVIIGIILIGMLVAGFFGMNGNFEFTGYSEFSFTVGSDAKVSSYNTGVKNIIENNGGKFDTLSLSGVGDDAAIIVRYIGDLTTEQQNAINDAISSKYQVSTDDVSSHVAVDPSITKADFIFTAAIILMLLAASTIFAYMRYNSASALAVILSNVIGILGFMSIGAIFRLQIGASYFAILLLLETLILFGCFIIFETIREESWLDVNDYSTAINSAMKKNRFRLCVLSCAVLLAGLLFVFFAPSAIKLISLNILFVAVAFLATMLYIVPFAWSIFITHSKRRPKSIKTTKKGKDDNESNDDITPTSSSDTVSAKIGG